MTNSSPTTGNLLSVAEAAEILQLSIALVRRYCATGRIQASKVGQDWAITPSALESFRTLERQRGRPTERQDAKAMSVPPQSDTPQSLPLSETDSKAMLGLLASGLIEIRKTHQTSKRRSDALGKSPPPHPKALILGWGYLSAACLRAGLLHTQPIGIDDLYTWCTRSLITWPIPKSLKEKLDPESVLLDLRLNDGEQRGITSWCEEWARSRLDLRSEFDEERIMPELRIACREHANGQAMYVRTRKFLIEHPSVSETDLLEFCNDLPTAVMDLLAGVDGAYVPAPPSLAHSGQFYLCPYCGSLLIRTDGLAPSSSADCLQRRCQDRQRRLARIVAPSGEMFRLANGIRRYVAEPGWAEIELENKLERMGLEVELWPQLDSYDLRVALPHTQETWGVDIKDWSNPVALGLRIQNRNGAAFAVNPSWDRAFFVFPDDLKQRRPHYVAEFKSECYSKLRTDRGQKIEAMFMRDFLAEARNQMRADHESTLV